MAIRADQRRDEESLQEQVNLADSCVRRGLEIAPQMLEGHKILAWNAMARERWDEVREETDLMETLAPLDPDVRNLRAELCYRDGQQAHSDGDPMRARDALERCVALRRDLIKGWAALATLLSEQEDVGIAFTRLREAQSTVESAAHSANSELTREARIEYWIYYFHFAEELGRQDAADHGFEMLEREYRLPPPEFIEDDALRNALNLAYMMATREETSAYHDCDFVHRLVETYGLSGLRGRGPKYDEALVAIDTHCP
jgi:tetratricopeptide (TPR) repeat protein